MASGIPLTTVEKFGYQHKPPSIVAASIQIYIAPNPHQRLRCHPPYEITTLTLLRSPLAHLRTLSYLAYFITFITATLCTFLFFPYLAGRQIRLQGNPQTPLIALRDPAVLEEMDKT